MTEASLPERPDDSEWRKAMAIRLLPFAALVVLMALWLINVKLGDTAAIVLIPIVAAVLFHFRSR
jgi:amino acid permease